MTKERIKQVCMTLLFLVVIVLASIAILWTKPSYDPLFTNKILDSNIIVAEYRGHKQLEGRDYSPPVEVRYKVIRYLLTNKKFKKMPQPGETITVFYQFQDGSATIQTGSTEFDRNIVLPEKKSKWILALTGERGGVYFNRWGSYGVKEYNSENLATIEAIIGRGSDH